VYKFSILYGDHHLVYNFHNLIHLTDDCDFYETSLNDIRAFPFESYIGKMKRDIKGTIKPLGQYDDDGSREEFFLCPMPATDLNIFVCDG
jgi:hypothetical protein